jgi:two-component system LytT family response regulator
MPTMKIRTLIVDDEPLARERIRSLLKAEPDFELVAECANGTEAVAAVKEKRPDLVFLDIQMPGMDGFEALRAIGKDAMPVVIFVTAFDQHALKAFEIHALDYLLKPFKVARFQETLKRARASVASRQSDGIPKGLLELIERVSGKPPAPDYLGRIAVKTSDRTFFVKTSQIDYIEAAGNYLVLHAGKENHVVRETLTALEEKLDPKKFIRINRSTMVNVEQIKELQPLFKGEHIVVLQNGKQLSLTRGIRELEELLRFC